MTDPNKMTEEARAAFDKEWIAFCVNEMGKQVEELKKLGWTQADFAKALTDLLSGKEMEILPTLANSPIHYLGKARETTQEAFLAEFPVWTTALLATSVDTRSTGPRTIQITENSPSVLRGVVIGRSFGDYRDNIEIGHLDSTKFYEICDSNGRRGFGVLVNLSGEPIFARFYNP